MIKQLILVGVGGGIGSIFRFLISRTIPFVQGSFPWATFIINITGCFIIGLLIGLLFKHPASAENMRLLLVVGFCGGFTTFSTFSLENVFMYQSGNYLALALYITLSVILGFAAVFLGLALSK